MKTDNKDKEANTFRTIDKLRGQFEFEKAAQHLVKLVSKLKKEKNWSDYITANIKLANTYKSLGNYTKSKQVVDRLFLLSKETPETFKSYLLRVYRFVGGMYISFDLYLKAIEYLKSCFDFLNDKNPEHLKIRANLYKDIGFSYYQIAHHEKALEYLNQALTLSIKLFGKKSIEVAEIYNAIAGPYVFIGDTKKGIEYSEKCLNLAIELLGKYHNNVQITANNLGAYYLTPIIESTEAGDEVKKQHYLKKAFDLFNFCLEILDKIHKGKNEHPDQAMVYHNMAHTYQNVNKQDEAIKYFNKALEIRQKKLSKYNIRTLRSLQYIALAYKDKGEYEICIEYMQEALKAIVLNFQSKSLATVPNFDNSYHLFDLLFVLKQKANILLEYFLKTKSIHHLNASIKNYKGISRLINKLRSSYNFESAKLNLAKISHELFESAIQANLSKYRINKNNSYLQQAFYFSEQSKAAILFSEITEKSAQANANISPSLLKKLSQVKLSLTSVNQKILQELNKLDNEQKRLKKLQKERFLLNEKHELLIQQLEKKYPNYHQLKYNDKPVDLKEIQKSLSNKEAIVSYFWGNENSYIFSITRTKLTVSEIIKPDNVEQLIENYKKAINQMNRKKFIDFGHQLFNILLKAPLENKNLKEVNSIQIIPDGILAEIPFESLITAPSETNTTYSSLPYLIQKYKVSYHYSATLLQWTIQQKNSRKKRKSKTNYIGFAPVYTNKKQKKSLLEAQRNIRIGDKKFQELLHSETEINAIQKQFKQHGFESKKWLHEKATTPRFKLEIKNYKYVHVAGHYVFNKKDPLLSGIIFSPSKQNKNIPTTEPILYIGDAYNLQINADLILLSCCDTGRGKIEKGEGVMAINRGFIYSGASNIIHTLFKVYDKSSAELVQHFFRQVLDKNKNYTEALQITKIDMIKNGAKPKHWAGYVLIAS